MPGHDSPKFPEITQEQFRVLEKLTTQRCANLFETIDLVGDMSADGLEVLRKLGDADHKPLRAFILEAKEDTLTFLTGLRKEEVQGLKAYLILRSTGSYLVYGIGAFIGGVVLVSAGVAAVVALWGYITGKGH